MDKNIKLPFGLKDGNLVHISEIDKATNGKKCNCICPSCGDLLTARAMGKIRTPHFSHRTSCCSYGLQTALHLFVKEVLSESKRIKLPRIATMFGIAKEERYFDYDDVQIENKLGDIIPDIVLIKGSARLIVEVSVTHYIDSEKEKKIEKLKLSCLELDMNHFEEDYLFFNKNSLKDKIIHNADFKHWIYSNLQEDYINKKRTEAENEIRLKKEKIKSRIDRIDQLSKVEVQISLINKLFREIPRDDIWAKVSRNLNVNISNIPYYLNAPIKGELVFNCHRIVWQSAIFNTWIYRRITNSGKTIISVQYVTEWIRKKGIKLNNDLVFTKDLELKDEVPCLSDVIADYLDYLCGYGYLKLSEMTTKTSKNKYYWFFESIRENMDIYPEKYNNDKYMYFGDNLIFKETGEIIEFV